MYPYNTIAPKGVIHKRTDFHVCQTKFQERLGDSCTAQTVKISWCDIERANIVGMARWLLCLYAKGAVVIEECNKRNRWLAQAVKTAERVLGVAAKKQNDPRFEIFARRPAGVLDASSGFPNPNAYSPYKTLNEMLIAIPFLADDLLRSAKCGDAIRREGPRQPCSSSENLLGSAARSSAMTGSLP